MVVALLLLFDGGLFEKGTPGFMAPEVVEGKSYDAKKADSM